MSCIAILLQNSYTWLLAGLSKSSTSYIYNTLIALYTYICTYIHTYIMHTHMHARTHARTHAHTHTHILLATIYLHFS